MSIRSRFLVCLALLPTAAAVAAAADIPPAFQGQWAANKAECDPKRPEADAVMVIKARQFSGYEYGCTIRRVDQVTATSFQGVALCTGEGNTSRQPVRWTLEDQGRRIRVEGTEVRTRCAAR